MNYIMIKNMIIFSWKNIKNHFLYWLYLAFITLVAIIITVATGCFLYGIVPNIYKEFNRSGLLEKPLWVIPYGVLAIITFVICYLIYHVLAKIVSYWFLQARNSLDLAQGKVMNMQQEMFQNFELLHGFILYRLLVIALSFGCIKLLPFFIIWLKIDTKYTLLVYYVLELIIYFLLIILYVRLYLYKFIILDTKSNALDAFTKSWKMTKGHFLELFLILWIDFCVPFFFVFNMIIPIQDLPSAYLYFQYKNKCD